jgi:hypothetical protein
MMGQIGLPPFDQIVDHPHGIVSLQQQVDHVAADEAGAAGDDGDRTGDGRRELWSF